MYTLCIILNKSHKANIMKTKPMTRKNTTVKAEIKRTAKEWAIVGVIFAGYLLSGAVDYFL